MSFKIEYVSSRVFSQTGAQSEPAGVSEAPFTSSSQHTHRAWTPSSGVRGSLRAGAQGLPCPGPSRPSPVSLQPASHPTRSWPRSAPPPLQHPDILVNPEHFLPFSLRIPEYLFNKVEHQHTALILAQLLQWRDEFQNSQNQWRF